MTDILTESSNPSTDTASDKFRQQLGDALSKIKITPELTIVHPGYEFPPVSQTYQNYLQQLSSTERDRYLVSKLQRHLYDLFMGRQSNSASDSSEPIVNSGDRWYETKFYHQLIQCNHGKGYADPGWQVVEQCDRRWQVTKNGLNLSIDPELHLLEPTAIAGQTVCIKMPPNLIERGVYIAVGDAGSIGERFGSTVLQIYFNVDAEAALILLDTLSKQLNQLTVPFNFKLAYSDRDYQYLDAAILELRKQDWQQLQPIISKIYEQNKAIFKFEVPFFCQNYRSGLGIAEKPNPITAGTGSNLGLEHCKVISEIIIKRLKDPNISLLSSMEYILKYCDRHKTAL